MNKNQKFVISINRELGSGGRTIGEKLAIKLNVPFYDKALIRELSKKYNLSVEEIETLKGRNHSWWADFERVVSIGQTMALSAESNIVNEPDFLTTDEIYRAEKEILLGIAEAKSCVIAGRTGFFVFKDHPNHLNIFIQASREYRIQRLMRKRNITEKEAASIIDSVDKMRENYVEKYTGTTRYDTRNYQLVISVDGKTEDQIVDMILQYIV